MKSERLDLHVLIHISDKTQSVVLRKKRNQFSNLNTHVLYLKKILHYRFDDFFGNKSNPHPLIFGRTPPELHYYLQIIEYLKVTYEPTEKSPMLHVYPI